MRLQLPPLFETVLVAIDDDDVGGDLVVAENEKRTFEVTFSSG